MQKIFLFGIEKYVLVCYNAFDDIKYFGEKI